MPGAIATAPPQWADCMAYNSSGSFANLCGLADIAPGQQDTAAMAITQSIIGAGTNIAQSILQAKAMKYQAEAQMRQEQLTKRQQQAHAFGGGGDWSSSPLLMIAAVVAVAAIGYTVYKKRKA